MTKVQRIKKVLTGLLMIACCAVLIKFPELGFYVVALILTVSLLLYAGRCLIFYFTMGRHMVGGKTQLFRGIIVLDLAVFTFSMVDDPKLFIIVYLLGIHAFSGLVGILRALEARSYQDPAWRRSLVNGIVNMVIAVLAVVTGLLLPSTDDLVYLYAACLFYSACTQIASAFRRTAIVYIQ